jgi:hypothetical protein
VKRAFHGRGWPFVAEQRARQIELGQSTERAWNTHLIEARLMQSWSRYESWAKENPRKEPPEAIASIEFDGKLSTHSPERPSRDLPPIPKKKSRQLADETYFTSLGQDDPFGVF